MPPIRWVRPFKVVCHGHQIAEVAVRNCSGKIVWLVDGLRQGQPQRDNGLWAS
jgi:hypothetical protein